MKQTEADGGFSGWGFWGAPLSWIYGLAVGVRAVSYDTGLRRVQTPPVPTVSVGGLEVGGTGKTPVAGYVLDQFLAQGRRPGLLTRGYGRRSRGLVVVDENTPKSAAEVGDEPAMLAASRKVFVGACARRVVAAEALVNAGCNCLVLDDGFSHRALGRHLDIVVLRGESPFGNGHLLPFGSLREAPAQLRRAQVLWFHHRTPHPGHVTDLVRVPWHREAHVVVSRMQTGAAFDLQGVRVALRDVVVVAACGIARPLGFLRSLRSAGAHVVAHRAFADHHRYREKDVQDLHALVVRTGAAGCVVTMKDKIKLAPLWPQGTPLWALDVALEIETGKDAFNALLQAL